MSELFTGGEPWPLSAPETLVLLWGTEGGDAYPLQVAFLELVARGYVRAGYFERKHLFGLRTQYRYAVARRHPGQVTGVESLDAVLAVMPESGLGVSLRDVAGLFLRQRISYMPRHGWGRDRPVLSDTGYVERGIVPELARHGLIARSEIPRNDSPSTPRWKSTDSGVNALRHVRGMLQIAQEDFPFWVTNEPGRAWDFLERAGSSLLLVRGLVGSVRALVATSPERYQAWQARVSSALAALSGVPGTRSMPASWIGPKEISTRCTQ